MLLGLIAFGFFYSLFISFYSGFYIGFVLMLITIGFASTIYCVDKRIDRKIIFYVWVAIITASALTLLLDFVFSMANLLSA